MESLKKKWNDLPLRRFFLLSVLGTVCLVAALSGLVISGGAAFRRYLLPDPDAVYLTVEWTMESGETTISTYLLEFGQDPEQFPQIMIENEDGSPVTEKDSTARYSVQRIEKSVDSLTPKRKLAYRACGVLMVAAPAFFSFGGILLLSLYVYRRKLRRPLKLLGDATQRIAGQDLDFTIDYGCGDEFGALSRSFEEMRRALLENNRAMWKLLEERRLLQASVAHDLRNPIAIIEGYTEYLEGALAQGELRPEKLGRIARNLRLAAKRLGRYTQSVGILNQWEETSLHKKRVAARGLAETMAEDFQLLARQAGMNLTVENLLPDAEILVDETILYRILENLMNNALRYARREILLKFSQSQKQLTVVVSDDGEGFSEEMLQKKRSLLPTPGKDGHMGIGLAVSRLLCQKHGGDLALGNGPTGAFVRADLLLI